jgi:methionine-rich copper-binding protein CopC
VLNSIHRRAIVAACGVAVALVLSPVNAYPTSAFHLALKRSDPAKDSVVTKAPTAIRLWFTQKPEMAVTTISLLDAKAAKVEVAPPRLDAADETEVMVDVKGNVKPGVYTVHWKTSSRDGHAIHGEFAFTVRAPK